MVSQMARTKLPSQSKSSPLNDEEKKARLEAMIEANEKKKMDLEAVIKKNQEKLENTLRILQNQRQALEKKM